MTINSITPLISHLREQLVLAPTAQSYAVAYSGGLDSHVLLHALVKLREQLPGLGLCALHVHHGLNPNADQWVAHCQAVCAALQVEFHCELLSSAPAPGDSVEAWAREARYAAFAQRLKAHEVLLTAHTEDDQAETVLLQLLRGSGPKGLAAMPQLQTFASGYLLRPFLNLSRRQLYEYAHQYGLKWIEDDSNSDMRFDRNFLRHRIIPGLRERWPQAAKNISRSAQHCAEASLNLHELASLDLTTPFTELLPIERLQVLSPARQRNLLRHWLVSLGRRLPNTRQMQRIQQDLINGRVDSQPQISWDGWIMRRYRQHLMMEPLKSTVNITDRMLWDLSAPLQLPHQLGELHARRELDGGLSMQIDPQRLTVGFRRGGERCRPAGKNHSVELKKLFQQWAVPPWQRSTVPLLFHDNEIAAIIGYTTCEPFTAAPGEISWRIVNNQLLSDV
jgi:tRNA(Ile)-lysidine synthase